MEPTILQLNLLPKKRHQILKTHSIYTHVRSTFIGAIVVFIILAGILQASSMLLSVSIDRQRAEATTLREQLESPEGVSYDEIIQQFNAKLKQVSALQTGHMYWPEIITDFIETIPEGIHITSAGFSSTTGNVSIDGVADTREQLLALQSSLSQSKRFSEPSTPLSNLLQRENIQFSFSLTLKK